MLMALTDGSDCGSARTTPTQGSQHHQHHHQMGAAGGSLPRLPSTVGDPHPPPPLQYMEGAAAFGSVVQNNESTIGGGRTYSRKVCLCDLLV